jgi:TrmH family RNA methyltransferase
MGKKLEVISSKQNDRIKNLIQLQKSSERRKQGVFIIEGIKEIEKAVMSGYNIVSAFFCPEIIEYSEVEKIIGQEHNINFFQVTQDVYSKVAYRDKAGGLILVAKPKQLLLENINVEKNPLLLIIEGVEKPGNIGAILRTADAAGISGIIICDPLTDLYNPNTIRASLGCVFTQSIALCSTAVAIEWLKKKSIRIIATHLKASKPYFQIDYTLPSAIVMGTEATGITKTWIEAADDSIIIPMRGVADSLNVSTATSILVFEACRQRYFN